MSIKSSKSKCISEYIKYNIYFYRFNKYIFTLRGLLIDIISIIRT